MDIIVLDSKFKGALDLAKCLHGSRGWFRVPDHKTKTSLTLHGSTDKTLICTWDRNRDEPFSAQKRICLSIEELQVDASLLAKYQVPIYFNYVWTDRDLVSHERKIKNTIYKCSHTAHSSVYSTANTTFNESDFGSKWFLDLELLQNIEGVSIVSHHENVKP